MYGFLAGVTASLSLHRVVVWVHACSPGLGVRSSVCLVFVLRFVCTIPPCVQSLSACVPPSCYCQTGLSSRCTLPCCVMPSCHGATGALAANAHSMLHVWFRQCLSTPVLLGLHMQAAGVGCCIDRTHSLLLSTGAPCRQMLYMQLFAVLRVPSASTHFCSQEVAEGSRGWLSLQADGQLAHHGCCWCCCGVWPLLFTRPLRLLLQPDVWPSAW